MIAIGDSIAVGIGAAAHIETHARVGASSCAILSWSPETSEPVIVSAGVNDPPGSCIERIRARLHGPVIWVLPPPINSARAHIMGVASAHGDHVISYAPGRDGLHPRSYSELAAKIR